MSIAPLFIGWGGVVSEKEPDTRSNGWPTCELYRWPVRRSRCASDTREDREIPLAPGNRPYRESKLQFSWQVTMTFLIRRDPPSSARVRKGMRSSATTTKGGAASHRPDGMVSVRKRELSWHFLLNFLAQVRTESIHTSAE